jgi:hypothetical protein
MKHYSMAIYMFKNCTTSVFSTWHFCFIVHSSLRKTFQLFIFSWASMSFILHLTCYQSHSSFFIFVFQELTLLNADLSFCVWKLEKFLFSATPLLSLFLLFVGNWWIWACLEIWHQKLAAYFIWKDCKTIAAFSFEMTNVLNDFKFSNCSISTFSYVVVLTHLSVSSFLQLLVNFCWYMIFCVLKELHVEQNNWEYSKGNWQYQIFIPLVSWTCFLYINRYMIKWLSCFIALVNSVLL